MFDSGVAIDILAPRNQVSLSSGLPEAGVPVYQRTLKSSISCVGVGLHSGARVTMTLHPATAGSGIAFRRTDIAGKGVVVPASWASVSDTRLNTCIANSDGVGVRTIEHLMAAMAGAGIDNALIDVGGPEVPVMDGSAFPFLFLIECAGVIEQDAPRMAIRVKKRVVIEDGDKMAALTPASAWSVNVGIDFPVAAIGRQECVLTFDGDGFRRDFARARTFGFEQEVAAMRAAGLGKGGSLDNAVVISSDGSAILNEDGLRYEDEFVRHKALDAVGDLYLAGAPLLGAYHGVRPGHTLNNRLLRSFFADAEAWEMVPCLHGEALARSLSDAPRSLALASA